MRLIQRWHMKHEESIWRHVLHQPRQAPLVVNQVLQDVGADNQVESSIERRAANGRELDLRVVVTLQSSGGVSDFVRARVDPEHPGLWKTSAQPPRQLPVTAAGVEDACRGGRCYGVS
jgi:hypothetical protein